MQEKSGQERKNQIPITAKNGKNYLLLIGIDQYAPEIGVLQNAVRDAKAIGKMLTEEYGFTLLANPLFDKDATHDKILDALEAAAETLGNADSLLVYYSGHGLLNPVLNTGYWLPIGAKKGLRSSYLPNSTVRDHIRAINCRHLVLVSDSCFAGTFLLKGTRATDNFSLLDLEKRDSRWVICSGREDQVVADGLGGTHSPFADSLLDILQNNEQQHFNLASIEQLLIQLTATKYPQTPVIAPLNDPKHKQGQFVFRKETDDDTLAYEAAKAKNTPAAYTDYLQKGYTKHAADVRTRHNALEAADREKRAAADRAAAAIREKNAYNLLDAKFAKGDLSLGDEIRLANSFLETFPQGNYIKNVKTLLENADAKFAELERLEQKRQAEILRKQEEEKKRKEKDEQERKAEALRKEEERKRKWQDGIEEQKRQAEIAHKREAERKRQADILRKQEEERKEKEEKERKQQEKLEQERQAEILRKQEIERKQEEERKAEIARKQEEERIRKQEEERVVKEARTLLYRRIGFTAAAATALYILFILIAPYFHKTDPHIDALVTDIENYTNAGDMETEAKNAWQNAYKLAPNDPRLQKWKGKYEN
ncbi:MAG: hypothetical protein RI894_880 [Bacteroidota bacterium]|jgi:hypothetical protein